MLEQNLFAGFGGQGVLLMGQLLAYGGMLENKYVSWLPSYGPEMRGGTANCSVNISDKPIGSPVVSNATTVVAMNGPSLDKFEHSIQKGGSLFINCSIIDKRASREDIDVYYIPCNEIAEKLGNAKVANMVMLGAYIAKTNCVGIDSVLDALRHKLGEKKERLIPINKEALLAGSGALSQMQQ